VGQISRGGHSTQGGNSGKEGKQASESIALLCELSREPFLWMELLLSGAWVEERVGCILAFKQCSSWNSKVRAPGTLLAELRLECLAGSLFYTCCSPRSNPRPLIPIQGVCSCAGFLWWACTSHYNARLPGAGPGQSSMAVPVLSLYKALGSVPNLPLPPRP
jgi:hypothetical protein